MINIWFSICNFGKEVCTPKSDALDWCRDWKVTENKYLELQLTHWGTSRLFALTLDTHFWGTDHAGPEFTMEILGWYFGIKFYDKRHWNYEEGRFETPEEAKAEADEWAAAQAQRVPTVPGSVVAEDVNQRYSEWSELEEVDTQVQPS